MDDLQIPVSPEQTLTPVEPPAPPRHSLFYRIFIGPNRLRAGWKFALFIILFAGITFLLYPLGKMHAKVGKGAALPAEVALLQESLLMTAIVGATAFMALIDRKPWGYFGMPLANALRSTFWVGAVTGVALLALQLELMHLGGWFDFGTLQLHGFAIVKYAVIWGLMFFCVGVFEEGLLRGYLLRVLTDGLRRIPGNWSFWASALIMSLLFAAGHLGNPGENKFGILMVFVDGFAMCFSLWRTGDLWFAIGNHAAWDWGQTFLFGTPNSGTHGANALMNPVFHGPVLLAGGSDGPEGSVLVLLSEALIFVVVALLYRRRKYPLLSDAEPATPSYAEFPSPSAGPVISQASVLPAGE
jgi:membrane protease YdiL (CAAX protease family)